MRSLPDGYDTVLDDEGGNVSAGEKQLLTIARAFLARPSVLILDEATSSVDTRTEVLVQKAMSALRSDRTSFVIAHRLSTIRDADLILVMEAGQIVEQGTHASLLEAGGASAGRTRHSSRLRWRRSKGHLRSDRPGLGGGNGSIWRRGLKTCRRRCRKARTSDTLEQDRGRSQNHGNAGEPLGRNEFHPPIRLPRLSTIVGECLFPPRILGRR